jgi:uncharacterized protein (TIGR02117 family)
MRVFKYIIYTILIPIASYLFISYILTFFPKKSKIAIEKKSRLIYIYHNSMHSDIIINTAETKINWHKIFPRLLKGRGDCYLEFGWGDRDTYLNTPLWSDLKPMVALKALFINTPSLIHITRYRYINNFSSIKKIKVTQEQYIDIEKRILKSFGSKPIFISKGYADNDAFYHSNSQYNILNTCNTWTGDILRDSNVTMSYWTPLSYNVVSSY